MTLNLIMIDFFFFNRNVLRDDAQFSLSFSNLTVLSLIRFRL